MFTAALLTKAKMWNQRAASHRSTYQKTWDKNTTESYSPIEMNEILSFGSRGHYIKLDKSITERQINTIDFSLSVKVGLKVVESCSSHQSPEREWGMKKKKGS